MLCSSQHATSITSRASYTNVITVESRSRHYQFKTPPLKKTRSCITLESPASQCARPLFPLTNPPIQLRAISRLESALERLRIRRQARLDRITLQRVQHRPISRLHRLGDLKRQHQPQKRSVQLPIRQMAARTHARPSPIRIMRRPLDLAIVKIPLGTKPRRLAEVRGVHVRGPGVHVERGAGGDHGARVGQRDRLYRRPRQADWDHGEEAQHLLDEGGDVRYFFLVQAARPGVAGWVGAEDGGVGGFLDRLPVWAGEVGDSHD